MKLIPNGVTQKVARQLLVAKKHSPRVLFVAGIAGVVTSTVLACRATLKLEETLEEMGDQIKNVKSLKEDHSDELKNSYPERQYHKDLVYVYGRGTYELTKLYAPSVVVGALSIAALTTSHLTLSRRNASLTAAYAAVAKSFDDYRERVKHELGEEKERDLYHAAEMVEGPDGEKVKGVDPNKWSPYARMFDMGNINWQKSPDMNRMFLQCQQNYANHLLQSRGHVFLNEVYDMLGFERSKAGQAVGWVVGNGDNYIDFGVFDAHNSRFVNGWEASIVLDFNVDGVVWDRI